MAERLAFGDFSTPAATQAVARVLFLATVAELAPAVVAALRDDVLPVYLATYHEVERRRTDPNAARRAVEEYSGRPWVCREPYHAPLRVCLDPYRVSLWQVVGLAAVSDEIAYYPDLLPLRRALEAWAKPHHVAEPWVFEYALVQCDLWRSWPTTAYPACRWPREPQQTQGPDRLRWTALAAAGPGSPVLAEERRFDFEHAGWDPTWTTRQAAKRAIREDFERRLADHLDAVASLVAGAGGFKRAKQYRSLRHHVAWTVRYQVLREPWTVIAATAERELANGRTVPVDDADYVAKTVKKTAKLLDLKLDQVRGPGCPAGSTNTHTGRDHRDTRSVSHRRR